MTQIELKISQDIRERLIHTDTLGFDVIGTLLDVRGSLIEEGPILNKRYKEQYGLELKIKWEDFADSFRTQYGQLMDKARIDSSYIKLDLLLKNALKDILPEAELDQLPQDEIDYLGKAWERAKPWKDVMPGLQKLGRKFNLVPITNANYSMIANMTNNNSLPWDHILSAETFQKYKDPEFYRSASTYLDFPPSDLTMIASHPGDLFDAAKAGWKRLVYVQRPLEFGYPPRTDIPKLPAHTIVVNGIDELANKL